MTNLNDKNAYNEAATQELTELLFCEEKPHGVVQGDRVLSCIKKGANPNAKNPDGLTFLMLACMTKQHLIVIEALIEAGADVHATNKFGFTALHTACQPYDEVDGSMTSQEYRIAIIDLLLESGADINAQTATGPDPEDPFQCSRVTPLHIAVAPNSVDVVKFLLSKEADPNIGEALKRTPLFAAVHANDQEMVKTLQEGGADSSCTCIHYYNPSTGEPVPVTFELNGVDGETEEIYPLDLAVMEEHQELASYLLSVGAEYTPGLTQVETGLHTNITDDLTTKLAEGKHHYELHMKDLNSEQIEHMKSEFEQYTWDMGFAVTDFEFKQDGDTFKILFDSKKYFDMEDVWNWDDQDLAQNIVTRILGKEQFICSTLWDWNSGLDFEEKDIVFIDDQQNEWAVEVGKYGDLSKIS
jgi:ankyrin repeat protein